MASFDDLAFVRSIRTAATSTNTSTIPAVFCPDCNEIPQATTPDRKRCLICGCELIDQNRSQPAHISDAITEFGGRGRDIESIMAQLMARLGGEGGLMGNGNGAMRPAAAQAVANLGSFEADQASTIEVALSVVGIKGDVVAIPANFGPCHSIPGAPVVIANPLDGATMTFVNESALKGKIVVMERGVCTFAQKVLRAQAAGAVAVMIIQTFDVWPYTMTDSRGTSKDITIPAYMLNMKQGKQFVEFLNKSPEPRAEIVVHKDSRECAICRGELRIGMMVTRMPCQHMFHTDCLHQWLKIGNSCPICRVEIQPKDQTGISTASSNTEQHFSWSSWFS